jgi:hypothetical protein
VTWLQEVVPGIDMLYFQMDQWLDISNKNLKLAASAVQQPDCFGYLMKLGHKWKAWKRRYCVLKDACLYFYQDGSSDGALGVFQFRLFIRGRYLNWSKSASRVNKF